MSLKYSRDGKVSFNAETHTYMLGSKRLTGVTSIISKYKNKFDSELMATNFALKHGLDKDELLKEWEEKSRKSVECGTAVHKVFEDYCETGEIFFTGNYEKEKIAIKFIEEMFHTGRLTPVAAEMIVYNESIASQIDCIAKDKAGNNYILDWKTNSKIETNSYNKKMLAPFKSVPDASYFHYSMQLAFYKRLCNEYDITGSFIVHIDDNNYKLLWPSPINIPDTVLFQQK